MAVCVRCEAELVSPYAFCTKCGSPQSPVQVPSAPPSPGYYLPYPYQPYRRPPSSRHLLILIAVLIVLMFALPAVLYMITPRITSGIPTRPFVTLSTPTVTSTSASFTVSGATPMVGITSYKFNIQVNGVWGVAMGLSSGNHTIAVGSSAFYVEYTDLAGNGNLKSGDVIRIGNAAGGSLPTGSCTFALLWAADGSIVTTVAWSV